MKINWGTGLVIGMVAFISFIMYFVVTMMTSNEYDYDLVVEDYYKAELHYQQDIDAEENALGLKEKVSILNQNGKWVIILSESFNLAKIEGNINLYRPSNKMLDFQIPLNDLTAHEIIIPNEKMIDGRWNINVNWKYRGEDYLYKKEIVY